MGRSLPPGAIPIESTRRVLPVKPFSTLLGPNAVPGQVVVKFKEEAEVRLRGKALAGQHSDMAAANHLLQMSKVNVARLMRASEAAVEAGHAQAKGRGDAALADLNAFYLLRLPTNNRSDQTNLIDALNQLDVVELAYAPGRTKLNWVTTPPAAPTAVSYEADQLYLNPPGWGVNARYAWDRGIKGAGVRVLDVEYGLNEQHEDIHFADNYLMSGLNCGELPIPQVDIYCYDLVRHGTAVAGVIIGLHNDYGVSGLAPAVGYGLVSLTTGFENGAPIMQMPSAGVNAAATDGISRYGDIVLVEVNSTLPEADRVGCVTVSGKASGPAEITLDGHSAVRAASLTGRIVVEGAANDGQQLETCFPEADLQNRINRNAPGFLDSGAIMVGGGYYNPSNTSEPIGIPYFTGFKYNYGNRLDVHGWGANVATAGAYSFSLNDSINRSQAYTKKFDGTSSASAVVAGTVALVQEHFKTLTRPNNPFQGLNSFEMRQLLVNTGTPQQPATDPQNNQSMHIGPLPNVATAMDPYLIYPMIKANGLRNNVNDPNDPNCQPCIKIARGSTVNLDMSIWDEKFTGTPVDWWFMVNWNGTTYYYTIDQGWITQQKPWFKNTNGLFGFWDWRWSSMRFDYPGTYTFYFGVDTIQNDTFMGNNNAISPSLYYDYVKIVVQ